MDTERNEARKFLIDTGSQEFSKQPIAYCYVAGAKFTTIAKSDICHRVLNQYIGDLTVAATGYYSPCTDNPLFSEDLLSASDAFFSWITDPEKSPWRVLFPKGLEVIKNDDGRVVGVILPDHSVDYMNWFTFKNFCIALRLVREYPRSALVWKGLVDRGITEAEAYYICKVYSVDSFGALLLSGDVNNGSHWPLDDRLHPFNVPETRCFSLETFLNGEPEPMAQGSCDIWCVPMGDKGRNKVFGGYRSTTFVQSRFSQVRQTTYEDIINHYNRWKGSRDPEKEIV